MSKEDVLVAMLAELGQEERSRRDPEHIFTAAVIGAFGAIAWGVATIATVTIQQPVRWFQHPAIVAAAGCFVLAVAVIAKIVREHAVYCDIRREQVAIAHKLANLCGLDVAELPRGFQLVDEARPGYWLSINLVFWAALAAVLFCISVWLFK
jgi:hypothetical protein